MTTTRAPHYLDVGQAIVPPAIVSAFPLTPIDLTGASTAEVLVRRPSGVESTYVGSVRDATAGLVEYVTTAEDLDETGTWRVQAHVVMPSGAEYHGPVGTMYVSAVLNGDTGTPEGVSSHAYRHEQGGADELLVEDLGSSGTSGEVAIADGSGGLDMGPVPTHASRHHHDGPDPLRVDDVAASTGHSEPVFPVTGPTSSGLVPGEITMLGLAQVASGVKSEIDGTITPEHLGSNAAGNETASDAHHWTIRRNIVAGTVRTITVDTLSYGVIIWYAVTAANAGLVFAQGTATLYGDGLRISEGEGALLMSLGGDGAIVVPYRRAARSRVQTITADHTLSDDDHDTIIVADTSGGDIAITVPSGLDAGVEVVINHKGSGALTFAGSGVTLRGPTSIGEDETAAVVVESGTEAIVV